MPIVYHYLWSRLRAAADATEDYETFRQLGIPLSDSSRDWAFNVRTGSFQYDIASTALLYAEKNNSMDLYIFPYLLPSLPPSCNPLLETKEIISAIPNFLALVPSTASHKTRHS
ncbi:hypothetical protein L218DRAFT_386729 [Marasmius fiardii PR-910]|nr:hypothetical protein L218DRAFT_386729 [Marasmius fiardii PR-910]